MDYLMQHFFLNFWYYISLHQFYEFPLSSWAARVLLMVEKTPICTHLTLNFFTGNLIALACGTGNKARWVWATSYAQFVIPQPPRGAELVEPYNGLVVRLARAACSQKIRFETLHCFGFPRRLGTSVLGAFWHLHTLSVHSGESAPPTHTQQGGGRSALIPLHFHIFTLLVSAHPRGWMEGRKRGRKSIIFWHQRDLCAWSPSWIPRFLPSC